MWGKNQETFPDVFLPGGEGRGGGTRFLFFPVEVAAVGADEVLRRITDNGTLILEKVKDRRISFHVNGVAQQLAEAGGIPGVSPVLGDVMIFQIADHIGKGVVGICVQAIDQQDLLCLFGDGHVAGGMDALKHCVCQLKTVGDPAAHVQTQAAAGIIGVGHPFLDGFPFQLGKHDADVEHGPADGGGGIEFFRGGDEFHMKGLKLFHHVGKIENGAADPIQFVDDDPADFSGLNIVHHLCKSRPVGVFSGKTPVGVCKKGRSVGFVLAVGQLAFHGNAVLFFYGLAGVQRII